MFIFIVIGFGLIGLGTITIRVGVGIIGTTLTIIMDGITGIDLIDHGIVGTVVLGIIRTIT